MAAQVREIRRSESCRWLPVSAPRPMRKGLCVTRTKRRAPSGETTSSTVSATMGTVSGIGPAYLRIVTRAEAHVRGDGHDARVRSIPRCGLVRVTHEGGTREDVIKSPQLVSNDANATELSQTYCKRLRRHSLGLW